MDTMSAFIRGEMNRGKELKVFDWVAAAEYIKANHITNCSAGLSGDLEYTCGEILRDGKPVPHDDTYTYLASNWATPVIVLADGEEVDCYRMQTKTPNWDAKTYWPEDALCILKES